MKYGSLVIFFVFSLIFLSLFISNVNADVIYNPNCTFYSKIKLINYSMKLYGPEDFDKNLVQNTKGFILFVVKTSGNWTDLRQNGIIISSHYTVRCGEVEFNFGGPADSEKSYSDNGSLVTEFSWNNNFIVPEKRFCYAYGRLLGINETWEVSSNCSYCACYINDLSGYSLQTDDTNVMTLQEFLLGKQLEEQKSQNVLNLQNYYLTIAIYILTFVTLLFNKTFRKDIENLKNSIGFATFSGFGTYLIFSSINGTTSINIGGIFQDLINLGYIFIGIVLIFLSFLILFPSLINPINKFMKRKIISPSNLIPIILIFYFCFGLLFTVTLFSLFFGIIGQVKINYALNGILSVIYLILAMGAYYLISDYTQKSKSIKKFAKRIKKLTKCR